jgi:hypothetical protein
MNFSMTRVAHAPTNSTFVSDLSPQLNIHLTYGAFTLFIDPPAPQFAPPSMDAPSEKLNVNPFNQLIGLSLNVFGLNSIGL